jgi:hypothetical protein
MGNLCGKKTNKIEINFPSSQPRPIIYLHLPQFESSANVILKKIGDNNLEEKHQEELVALKKKHKKELQILKYRYKTGRYYHTNSTNLNLINTLEKVNKRKLIKKHQMDIENLVKNQSEENNNL